MPRKGQRKCAGCGEWVQTDWEQPGYDGDYRYGRSGNLFCYGCFESAQQYASTVIAIEPQDPSAGDWSLTADEEAALGPWSQITRTIFDEEFVFLVEVDGDYADAADDDAYPEPVAGQGWHRSDAWRGHATFELLDGFEDVESGWVTGFPDETTRRKADLGELFESLRLGAIVPPVPLWWVFGITSNVFSQTCDIVVKSEDRERLEKWLEQCAGTSVEELRYQLG